MSELIYQEEQHHEALRRKVDELVRCSLIQLGDIRDASERIHSLGEKLSLVTERFPTSAEEVGKKAQG